MRISPYKFEAMVVIQKKGWLAPFGLVEKACLKWRSLSTLRSCEVDQCTGLLWWKKTGWNNQPINAPTLTYGPEFWIMTERTRSQTQVTKIVWLRFTWRLGLLLQTPPSGSVPGMSHQVNNPKYAGEIVGALERLGICLEELRLGKSGHFWLDCCL